MCVRLCTLNYSEIDGILHDEKFDTQTNRMHTHHTTHHLLFLSNCMWILLKLQQSSCVIIIFFFLCVNLSHQTRTISRSNLARRSATESQWPPHWQARYKTKWTDIYWKEILLRKSWTCLTIYGILHFKWSFWTFDALTCTYQNVKIDRQIDGISFLIFQSTDILRFCSLFFSFQKLLLKM